MDRMGLCGIGFVKIELAPTLIGKDLVVCNYFQGFLSRIVIFDLNYSFHPF